MTRILGTFGSRDGAFYDGAMGIATHVPREHVSLANLSAAFMAHYQIAPAAASAVAILAATALADGKAKTIGSGITQPDVPRILTVKGSVAGIAGDVVISGTNYAGEEITDTIALNGATEVEGAAAFRTVTEIVLPARNAEGDTVSVGIGKKLGLPHKVAYPTCLLVKLFNGTADTGTLAVDATHLEKNLFALNGAPNGVKLVDLYYLV